MLRRYQVTVAGQASTVELEELDGVTRVTVDGRERRIEVRPAGPNAVTWLDGTRLVEARLDGALPRPTVALRGLTVPVEVADPRASVPALATRARPVGPLSIRAPMPGRVVRVLAAVGDKLPAGRALLVIEAMKMENELRAPREGTLTELHCAEGAAVESGQLLAVLT